MTINHEEEDFSIDDNAFQDAIKLFNKKEWYSAHDAFEEIWHNTNGKERIIIQAILQIAVAEVHLTNGNIKGATILYGEGLGRLKNNLLIDLGIDIPRLVQIAEMKLNVLQKEGDFGELIAPQLLRPTSQ